VKLKLDENLSHAAADLFRRAGHDIQTARSEGLSGASDQEVIAACRREERALVTLDLDFSNPLVFNPMEYSGIAVLRLPSKPSRDDLVIACRTLLGALRHEVLSGKLWSVERGRLRVYRPERPDEPGGEM
jgi:predicted nuclease of predicted toxin-antitoxin system